MAHVAWRGGDVGSPVGSAIHVLAERMTKGPTCFVSANMARTTISLVRCSVPFCFPCVPSVGETPGAKPCTLSSVPRPDMRTAYPARGYVRIPKKVHPNERSRNRASGGKKGVETCSLPHRVRQTGCHVVTSQNAHVCRRMSGLRCRTVVAACSCQVRVRVISWSGASASEVLARIWRALVQG